jgi:hypothetical protein
MNKKFRGFTDTQKEAIARKMGYKDSMDGFDNWASSSPDRASKLSRYHEKARKFIEEPVEEMATGGTVKKKTTQSQATKLSNQAITNPESLVTEAPVVKTATNPNQLIDKNAGNAGKAKTATANTNVQANTTTAKTATADPAATAATAGNVAEKDANTYDATQVGDDVNGVLDDVNAVQGTVSQNSQAEAATALPSSDATVQGQMEKLMSQFNGGQTPAWAAGAMRMANQAMAARGLGASSMAGGAITQAAMESAIGIAATDAATFSQFEMQNLNNRQQARLQNAQAFLQMDLANLDVANQTNLFKAQSRIQAMFTDQAADNAAKQFNATSQNQTDQFFSQLKSQTQQFNAAQQNAMKQFNVGQSNTMKQFNVAQQNTVGMFNSEQTNTMKQFNAQQQAALSMFNTEQINGRDQFNANNRLIIDQSNAEWRRQIATQDNAQINETNRLNAQLSTGMTTQAYNNIWQQERDLMAFAFTAAENSNQRSHEVVMQKMTNGSYKDIAKYQAKQAQGAAVGNLISSVVLGSDWGGIF